SPRKQRIGMCPRCKSRFWDVPLLRKLPRGTGLGIAEVIGPHREEIRRLVRQHKARRIRVFGSVARSSADPRSDVDFLVEFRADASAYDQVELILDLEKVLRRKVDVTTEASLHWLVRPQAVLEAVTL
ncbi:Nucleotidyltransferase domain protein, partial [mine drainage metagenome]